MGKKRIGEYLIDAKRVTPEQLQRALDLQVLQLSGTEALLGNVLFQLGLIEEQDIAAALKQQQGDRTEPVANPF